MSFPHYELAIVSALLVAAGVFVADGLAGRRTAGRHDATVSKLKEATTNAYLAPPPGPF
jgi:hypothetical protein